MSDTALTPDRILDVAEEVLRRYGLGKATVVDVARVLEVSHGSIYRHFPSKTALRDAVAERWLHRVSAPLATIVQEPETALERLHRWLTTLIALKRQKVMDDPELFATYHAIVEESREVVQAHVDELVSQLTQIVADGLTNGEFKSSTPSDQPSALPIASAIFSATARFHHPAHAAEWSDPAIDEDFAQVWRLICGGLVSQPIG